VVNVEGRIFTKTGTPVSTFALNTFFGEPSSTVMFDPKIRFDPQSQRWFVAMMTSDNPDTFVAGSWRLAVSTSDDPTGTFVLYMFRPSGHAPDFPGLGINDDKVVLTANAFNGTCDTCLLGSEFVVFNKAQLLAGTSATTQFFPPDQGFFSIQPAHSLSSTTSLFMAAVDFGTATSMRIWFVTGVPGVEGGATLATTDRAINPLAIPPSAVQQGASTLIDTNDNRLLDAVFRDGSLWVAANSACTPSGDFLPRACLRFIQVLTDSLTVAQGFNFGTPQTYYYYPVIQTDSANNLITVFSRSSSVEFASVYASDRLVTDPPNTLQPPVLIHAGEAPSQLSFVNMLRWGDYSGAGIDPVDQTTVWVAGEYARVEGGSEWGTWIAQLTPATTNPNPRTCSVFPFAGVLSQPFSLTFALILRNYAASPQTFSVNAFIDGAVLRVRTVTLAADAFVGLSPGDIPILPGELADIYVCWGPGPPGPPAVLLLLSFADHFVFESSVANLFLP
jgi:hypothetical protein